MYVWSHNFLGSSSNWLFFRPCTQFHLLFSLKSFLIEDLLVNIVYLTNVGAPQNGVQWAFWCLIFYDISILYMYEALHNFPFCKMLALEDVLPAIKPSVHFPVKQNQRLLLALDYLPMPRGSSPCVPSTTIAPMSPLLIKVSKTESESWLIMTEQGTPSHSGFRNCQHKIPLHRASYFYSDPITMWSNIRRSGILVYIQFFQSYPQIGFHAR